ncbi:MAG: hypothetical protein R6V00_05190 [Candidatus Aminicenantes bacterium]
MDALNSQQNKDIASVQGTIGSYAESMIKTRKSLFTELNTEKKLIDASTANPVDSMCTEYQSMKKGVFSDKISLFDQ